MQWIISTDGDISITVKQLWLSAATLEFKACTINFNVYNFTLPSDFSQTSSTLICIYISFVILDVFIFVV